MHELGHESHFRTIRGELGDAFLLGKFFGISFVGELNENGSLKEIQYNGQVLGPRKHNNGP